MTMYRIVKIDASHSMTIGASVRTTIAATGDAEDDVDAIGASAVCQRAPLDTAP